MKRVSLFLLCVLLSGGLLFCACAPFDPGTQGEDPVGTQQSETASDEASSAALNESEMFTERDFETDYDAQTAVQITLGSTITSTSDSVKISQNTAVLSEEATYLVRGTLADGSLIVDAPDTTKIHLVFDGVSITSKTSAALYIKEADKVFLTLTPESDNSLTSGESFVAVDENNIDAALFSKADLTVNGTGSLSITSPAGHGIAAKDDLVFAGGSITVSSAAHAIDANDSVRATGTAFTLVSGKDGIHAEHSEDAEKGFVYLKNGDFSITAEGDGISASAYLSVTDGTFNILAGGGYENGESPSSENWGGFMGGMGGGMQAPGRRSVVQTASLSASEADDTQDDSQSMKGLKSGTLLLLSGGDFTLDTADDALHANTSMTISGGNFTISSGDDALHAEETLCVLGGAISVAHSYEGLEALDISFEDGTCEINATDDGFNAAGGTDQSGMGGRDNMQAPGGGGMSAGGGSIAISGGTVSITASGDGIDANGTLLISGGSITVTGPTQGDTATLDYDTSAEITGGTFVGTGASGMAQTFSGGTQGVIALSVGQQSANTEITLLDASGKTLLTHKPALEYSVVILSSPDVVSGETYSVKVGDLSGEFEAS